MTKWYTNMVDDVKSMLHSNDPIGKIENGKAIAPKSVFGALPVAIGNSRRQGSPGILKEIDNAHRVDGKEGGKLNYAAIAGSFMVAGAGYRALSGGGVYRDSNGNTDIAGIPFI